MFFIRLCRDKGLQAEFSKRRGHMFRQRDMPHVVQCIGDAGGLRQLQEDFRAAPRIVQGGDDAPGGDVGDGLCGQRPSRPRFVNFDRVDLMAGGAQTCLENGLSVAPGQIKEMRRSLIALEKTRKDRLGVPGDNIGVEAKRARRFGGFLADGVQRRRSELARTTGERDALRAGHDDGVILSVRNDRVSGGEFQHRRKHGGVTKSPQLPRGARGVFSRAQHQDKIHISPATPCGRRSRISLPASAPISAASMARPRRRTT